MTTQPPLRLVLHQPLEQHLNAEALSPAGLHGLSLAGISRLMLHYGGRATRLDQLFAVYDGDRGHVALSGSRLLYGVGRGMSRGRISVAGDCGDFVGQGMVGGELCIAGDAGDYAGWGLCGGWLRIAGSAGDFLGASAGRLRFEPQSGLGAGWQPRSPSKASGLISVGGNAGARLGDRMRRGCIVVHGDVGDYCASRLSAGTIVVRGRAGYTLAWGMQRGSVILEQVPERLPAPFRPGGLVQLSFLPLLFRQLASLDQEFAVLSTHGPWAERLMGDVACGARGEVLILRQ